MGSLYDVCFAGQILEGQQLQSVRQNLQKLFKANPETLDRLFSGKTEMLKRGCDKATALKYKQAMERAGAKAVIKASPVGSAITDVTAATAPAEPATQSQDNTQQDQTLDLAPVGADVLRSDERAPTVEVEIDTSALNIAAVGTTLGQNITDDETAPDTSHLSMSAVGEPIPNLVSTSTPLNPNTDDITLSPPDSDFSDCAPPAAATPELDLSKIEVAPEGSDVLEEHYKKVEGAIAPSTDHISLQD